MSRFKICASVTLISKKKQAPLYVDNGHISFYGGFYEINRNEKQSKSIVYSLW